MACWEERTLDPPGPERKRERVLFATNRVKEAQGGTRRLKKRAAAGTRRSRGKAPDGMPIRDLCSRSNPKQTKKKKKLSTPPFHQLYFLKKKEEREITS